MPTDACLPSLPEIAHDSARVHHRIAAPPPTASRSVHRSAFTVYGIAVRKGASNWQVFRRYREWEDLRMRLLQELGSAPPMPPKMLFGRMRPEVIENRVLGLNHFLQLCLNTHMFASHPVLHDFLERNKNVPPEGLDLALLDTPLEGGASGIMDGTPQGLRQQQLKDLVESASQAFISVAQEQPVLDSSYLAERARLYASAIAASNKLPPCLLPGTRLKLEPDNQQASGTPAVTGAFDFTSLRDQLEAGSLRPAEAALLQHTTAAVAQAVKQIAVHSKTEVLHSSS